MISSDILWLVLVSGGINLLIWTVAAYIGLIRLKFPIYHPYVIFLAYHFIGYIVRPFSIYLNDGSFLWDRIGVYPSFMDIIRVTVVTNLALGAIVVGALTSRNIVYDDKVNPIILEAKNKNMFFVLYFILFGLGLYANYISIAGAGLDSVLAYDVKWAADKGGMELVGVSGYQTALAEFIPSLLILLYLMPQYRRLAYILIASYVGIRVYAGAQRLSFIVVVLAILFLQLIEKRKKFPDIRVVLMVAILALTFDVVGSDRYALRRIMDGDMDLSEVISNYSNSRGGNGLSSDAVEYDVATATLKVVDENYDFSYGTQYLRLLLWGIPRQLWADKPIMTSIVDLNKYGDFRYLTTGIYSDAYMVLSYPALMLIMFWLGRFMVYAGNIMRRTSKPVMYIFSWIVLIYFKTVLRDGGVTFAYFWIFSMVPILIIAKFSKLKLLRLE